MQHTSIQPKNMHPFASLSQDDCLQYRDSLCWCELDLPDCKPFHPAMSLSRRYAPISEAEIDALRQGAEVLEADSRGDKVLLTRDDRIIKLFYPRRRLTSARLFPYAGRFWNNAERLRSLGIATVHCEQLRFDKDRQRHLISYPRIPGTTLRSLLQTATDTDRLLQRFAAYLADLHDKGILFRSIHLGNVLMQDEDEFALIDIADMHIWRHPLGMLKRARNFRHLLHDRRDREILNAYGYARFLTKYEAAANINGMRSRILHHLLQRFAPEMLKGSV